MQVKLKEECAQLRLELTKARHRLNQLEGSRRAGVLGRRSHMISLETMKNDENMIKTLLKHA